MSSTLRHQHVADTMSTTCRQHNVTNTTSPFKADCLNTWHFIPTTHAQSNTISTSLSTYNRFIYVKHLQSHSGSVDRDQDSRPRKARLNSCTITLDKFSNSILLHFTPLYEWATGCRHWGILFENWFSALRICCSDPLLQSHVTHVKCITWKFIILEWKPVNSFLKWSSLNANEISLCWTLLSRCIVININVPINNGMQ